ncbi:CRISPR-associated endonuclease Cas3'' [Rhodobacteraceae bacterium RKSG542]|uniref:CRISPR-associated endonuclease Cas3'' n=1 Tax=Pseudovibrio flavus TaxID=2529854 RepID=UPI0012BC7BF1|nr:CRISPR-associated endonuclease Cas3'' [Pseudovibrio flavus]MTI15941.1 CRISPR-associated endonuclease Cas3'' [Pseudovibrio flavus]
MREVIAVCRSSKKARVKVAQVLDRYFWRIGDRTWRGKATNACLDRVARELRKDAKRNTAVSIQEIRSASESREPLILIGSRSAFGPFGRVPVASHPAKASRSAFSDVLRSDRATLLMAVLFHDLGKSTRLFQEKLARALEGGKPEADPVRHELISVMAWKHLVLGLDDTGVIAKLKALTAEDVAAAFHDAGKACQDPNKPHSVLFDEDALPSRLARSVAMLVLTHHRLPSSDSGSFHLPTGAQHLRSSDTFDSALLQPAQGRALWEEPWWFEEVKRTAEDLVSEIGGHQIDLRLRTAMMFADHLGSAQKQATEPPDSTHLANTIEVTGQDKTKAKTFTAADSLLEHTRKVLRCARQSFDMVHRLQDRFPALMEHEAPTQIAFPTPPEEMPQFHWQAKAAQAARTLCGAAEGGFFGCLMAGTGSGKTRGAPTIMAAASFGDSRPERRALRMVLGLGLRSLTTQSAQEYVDELGFAERALSVLVGQVPLAFKTHDDEETEDERTGSESLMRLPDWLQIEMARGAVPAVGSAEEADWMKGLSLDTDRQLPAFCSLLIEESGKPEAFRRLIDAPIAVATIDHLAGVASPVRSRFLPQALRVLTSDLIIDEVDQFGDEDLAVLTRLAYQVGAAGRRLIIMSATMPEDISAAMFKAYRSGWRTYAQTFEVADKVNLLCVGDTPESCFVEAGAETMNATFGKCRDAIVAQLDQAPALRMGRILPPATGWQELVGQVDAAATQLHEANAVEVGGLQLSVGLVRMTRVSHTAALAVQLPAGYLPDRDTLRLKLCLHSQFPRLHRNWIESLLKQALRRKGAIPNRGLEALFKRFGAFEKAQAHGARKIELVVITSPVIETGNDLDFDWAIVDPVSLRAIIQTAGRVNRHRMCAVNEPNVALLGMSPIVMEEGKLAYPGVETEHKGTGVSPANLGSNKEDRATDRLLGTEDFKVISARSLLTYEGEVPLRRHEREMRTGMIDPQGSHRLLTWFLEHYETRMTKSVYDLRVFRRPDGRKEALYVWMGESFEEAEWHENHQPEDWRSRLKPVSSPFTQTDLPQAPWLLQDMTQNAWADYAPRGPEMSVQDLQRLMQVSLQFWEQDWAERKVIANDYFGLVRGSEKDLFSAFGKDK